VWCSEAKLLLVVSEETDDDEHSNFTTVLFPLAQMCLERVIFLVCICLLS